MKQVFHCAWCCAEVLRYACNVQNRVFCCKEHRSLFLRKDTNPDGYLRHAHLSAFNEEHNAERMTLDVRAKLRAKARMRGNGKTYRKWVGRHEHRVVAELMLGRPLRSGEVVHHIDGNRLNNDHKNLMVFASQAEHAAHHQKQKEVMPT